VVHVALLQLLPSRLLLPLLLGPIPLSCVAFWGGGDCLAPEVPLTEFFGAPAGGACGDLFGK
jgi:hypothetical protein